MSLSIMPPTAFDAFSCGWGYQERAYQKYKQLMGKETATFECASILLESPKDTMVLNRKREKLSADSCPKAKRDSKRARKDCLSGPITPPPKDLAQKEGVSSLNPTSALESVVDVTIKTSATSLDSLSWELKLQVLQHLPAADLSRMAQVNKAYRSLCSCDLLWALQCYKSRVCQAAPMESWRWNYAAASIGIVHARLLDDSNPNNILRLQGDAYVIDPMHAFFTSDTNHWRWFQEFLPILEALDNADVIVTYRGIPCGVIQTRFGEGAYQVTRRGHPVGTVTSTSGFLAIVPKRLMEILQEENAVRKDKEKKCIDQAQGVLVRNLDGTLFTSRTGDFFVSSIWKGRGNIEKDVTGLDVPIDLMVTTGGDWSTYEEDDEEELEEEDLMFLEEVMSAEKKPATTSTSDYQGESSVDNAEFCADWWPL